MSRRSATRTPRGVLTLAAPAAVIGYLVLNGGGFDLPQRQQEALLVWWLIGIAVTFAVFPRSRPPSAWRWAAAGAGALVALSLLAVSWGPSDESAVDAAAQLIGYAAVPALAWVSLGPRSWRSAATGIFLISAGAVLYALLSRLFPGVGVSSTLNDQLANERLFEPLGYWNALGAWSAMTLAMSLALGVGVLRSKWRGAALAMAPLCVAVIYLTYSRGAVAGAAIGAVFVLALSRDRRRAITGGAAVAAASALLIVTIRSQQEIASGTGTGGAGLVIVAALVAVAGCWLAGSSRRRRTARPLRRPAIALTVVLAAVVLSAALAVGAADSRFTKAGENGALSGPDGAERLTTAAGNRTEYWAQALDALAAQPIRGEGPGSFQYRWARNATVPELVTNAHSLELETGAELGLPGLLALLVMLGGITTAAVAGLRAAEFAGPALGLAGACVVFAISISIDWTWDVPALALLGLVCAATLSMAASKPIVKRRREPRPPAGWRRFALAAVAILAGVAQIPGIVATDLTRRSLEQRFLGASAVAIASASDAIDAAPWQASPYDARARAEFDAGDLSAGRSDAEEAVHREPLAPGHRLLLAQILEADNDPGGALRELRTLYRLSPRSSLVRARATRRLVRKVRLQKRALRGAPKAEPSG